MSGEVTGVGETIASTVTWYSPARLFSTRRMLSFIIRTISGFWLTGMRPLSIGVTPMAMAWLAYQLSMPTSLLRALVRLTALSASCCGTECRPVEPPDSTLALACTWREKLVIMSRKESAAVPFHGPSSPASALAWSIRRRLPPPQPVDHPLDRHRVPAPGQQQRQHRPLPRPSQIGRHPVDIGFDGPEHSDVKHGGATMPAPPPVGTPDRPRTAPLLVPTGPGGWAQGPPAMIGRSGGRTQWWSAEDAVNDGGALCRWPRNRCGNWGF
ncbi:hypothetical protein [Actinacidiphila sp. ITFR-21]|uniref:hypothetical protein n=1 Tax=Actinacidiphila sp. ITFR-21 TaxID=3075199 RepID=UPI0028899DA6|nr:hypothetical protein [Streptomyces sp. ITFR-21]WNI16810.1 hypothetical protein RLT57_15655 [Streptomyces sp. ITFR-21]